GPPPRASVKERHLGFIFARGNRLGRIAMRADFPSARNSIAAAQNLDSKSNVPWRVLLISLS
ncbi:MAG TPA: hypothetical protein VN517_11255, partial [Terriglobales bacterium]|nr:hypothetical protein [Terriglobales bacterium]